MSPPDSYQRWWAFKPPCFGQRITYPLSLNQPGKVATAILSRLFILCPVALSLIGCKPASNAVDPINQSAPFTVTSQTLSPTEIPSSATPTRTLTPTPTFTTTSSPTPTSTSLPTQTSTITPTPTTSLPPEAISWEQANKYVGEQVIVCGPVVDGVYAQESRGKPTFLNVGLPYPEAGRLTILIWGDDRSLFSVPPEELYVNKTICVKGQIELYRGVAEIVVEQPEQIQMP